MSLNKKKKKLKPFKKWKMKEYFINKNKKTKTFQDIYKYDMNIKYSRDEISK